MGCHGMVHLTRGLAYCPQTEVVEGETRYVLPFNLNLTATNFKLNLKSLEPIQLNSILSTTKFSLIHLPNLNLNNKLSTFKLNLKKCED